MKKIIKKILPQCFLGFVQKRRRTNQWKQSMHEWKSRDFLGYSPQMIKEKIFLRYGVEDASWIETGTYMGATTKFLSEHYHHVYSIQPQKNLYDNACERFQEENVTLFNDVSESILPSLLPILKGNFNFWLDGHYSAGITFRGSKDCPVVEELEAIERNFSNFEKITILIDDVRCFLPDQAFHSDYPSIDYLVDWARRMDLRWRIEHDIFIMQNS